MAGSLENLIPEFHAELRRLRKVCGLTLKMWPRTAEKSSGERNPMIGLFPSVYARETFTERLAIGFLKEGHTRLALGAMLRNHSFRLGKQDEVGICFNL